LGIITVGASSFHLRVRSTLLERDEASACRTVNSRRRTFVAAMHTAKEVIWTRIFLSEIIRPLTLPIHPLLRQSIRHRTHKGRAILRTHETYRHSTSVYLRGRRVWIIRVRPLPNRTYDCGCVDEGLTLRKGRILQRSPRSRLGALDFKPERHGP
jgi:hypothetical protein